MTARMYYDNDADPNALAGQTVAIIGYGSQGHAHARNLHESGIDVVVGLKPGSKSRALAEEAGLRVADVAEAVQAADVIMIAVPDTLQKSVYDAEIEPHLRPGQLLMFAHGFNIRFGRISPPTHIDVGMVAPKGPGHLLRSVYEAGGGVPALFAVENDANVATLAEWRLGAGRGVDDLVMLTLGTGVGGGVVTGGSLFRGWAELGHVVVVPDGPRCQGVCTGRGHLEAVASGNAGDRAAEEIWGEGANAELLVGRAGEGDEEALSALAQIGHLLGLAVGSFANVFGAELVVVGGGFGVAAAEFLFPSALEAARREALPPAADLRIATAELGGDAGAIGAGLLALEALGEA